MFSLILWLGLVVPVLAQNLAEGPWFDYHVNGINRLSARATSYSFDDQTKALAGDRENSRMVSNTLVSFLFFVSKRTKIP